MNPIVRASVAAMTVWASFLVWSWALGGPNFDPGSGSPLTAIHDLAGSLNGGLMPVTAVGLALILWLLAAIRTGRTFHRIHDQKPPQRLAVELGLEAGELSTLPAHVIAKLEEQVAFDDLTGVMRRSTGVASVEREVARAQRAGNGLTVAFIDVDGLKKVNDSQGHAAGDALLRAVANAILGRLRGEDTVFRYGGDEFVCVLPGADVAGCRGAFAGIQAELSVREITISVGLAAWQPGDTAAMLMARADTDLYDLRSRHHDSGMVPWLGSRPTPYPS